MAPRSRKIPVVGEACGRCAYWEQIPNGRGDRAVGDCHGQPPTVIGVDTEGGILQARPRLEAGARACSLFKPVLDA